jgi:endonuclease-3
MSLFGTTDWAQKLQPINNLYKNKKHPLDYENLYQLIVMVILSTQDSDANINKVAPPLFEAFPNLKSLAKSSIEN